LLPVAPSPYIAYLGVAMNPSRRQTAELVADKALLLGDAAAAAATATPHPGTAKSGMMTRCQSFTSPSRITNFNDYD